MPAFWRYALALALVLLALALEAHRAPLLLLAGLALLLGRPRTCPRA
ncbi:MAG: hypothetical protein NZ846_06070 [Thermus sp.]|nr:MULTISPECIES: hypothetical protein [unclassified Thermus]AEV16223.1 hypothetical protein TCCBUS3UF1_11790 [Thermus sp. CCB_US3_UF1]MCS6867524.1 hypothetical protein [Thermus sp.]MCS7218528.1 hypothetical protein [Thermus sp.]MCX7849954.1 hypothetical protein [Thermus sp.]MDW8017694.1 hypothetical protein [Thermus sp.]